MKINKVLSELRVQNNLTQQEIANIIDVGYSTYKNYEDGIQLINLEKLNFLSNYYNVSLNYIFGLSKIKRTDNFQKEIDYSYLRFSIVYLRKRARLTQKALAKEFGISVCSLRDYEHNGINIPPQYILKIAQKFQYSIDYICGKSLKKEIL